MTDVTQTHEEKESLAVDVLLPGHEPRVTTALFIHSKKQLMEREGGRCFVCGRNADQAGSPIESHHHPIERSLANMIDWQRFRKDCEAGMWGPHAQAFDWSSFSESDPYTFVDDQTVNGLLLCADHHRGKDEGIHMLPYPLFIAQKYGKDGYQFSAIEVIHHAT